MSSIASSSNSCIVCASISALDGSTRNNVGWSVERRICEYDRKRVIRSSPPHEVVNPGVREPVSNTRGGYEAVAVRRPIAGETGVALNDLDSSSWKYNVGSVEPLIRLIAIEPSVE